MKKIYILALVLSAAFLASGCIREEVRDNEGGKGEVVFRVSLDEFTTKTTTPGEGAENTVSNLDFIIFKSDGTFLYKWHDNAPTPTTAGYYEQTAKVITIGGSTAILQKAKTLAIANYPGDGSVFDGKTLAQVQALSLEAHNGSEEDAASTGKFLFSAGDNTYQNLSSPSFVMTSTLGSFDKEADDLVSEVKLRRLAAKVSLTLKYAYDPNDPVVENRAIVTDGPEVGGFATKTVWTPMIGDNTRVYLDNGSLDATLNGLSAAPTVFRYSDNHPSYDNNTTDAFYTYPLSWETGSARAPFIKIIQPWHYVTSYNAGTNADPSIVIVDENVVELYYKVMFPGVTMLESNTWYHPTVTLDVLGGEADDPVELKGIGMEILDWGGDPSTGVGDIEDIHVEPAKYLVPEFHEITVHNGHGAVINYIASDEPTVTVNAIHKDVYINYDTQTKYIFDPAPAKSPDFRDTGIDDEFSGISTDPGHVGELITPYTNGYWFQNIYDPVTRKGQIILHHTLSGEPYQADGTTKVANFAARPYTYELTLSLTGVNSQDVTIIQNPPLLAEGKMSTGWVAVNSVTSDFATSGAGLYRARESGDSDSGLSYTSVFSSRELHVKWYANKTPIRALGAVSTYRYLNNAPATPLAANMCRWMVIIHPSVEENRYLLDNRISIETNNVVNTTSNRFTGDFGLYEIINQYGLTSDTDGHEGPALFESGFVFHHTYPGPDPANPNAGAETTLTASTYATETGYLKYYRPTEKKVSTTTKADPLPGTVPEYMVASSYGKTIAQSYISSVARCAAYQEDGYPAGRWRVPSETEIEIAIDLARRGAIPNLFDGKYWASSGRYYESSTRKWASGDEDQITVSAAGIGVRCVYDTWYWGREEVAELKNPDTNVFGKDFTKWQYKWSGYSYTKK